MAEPEVTLSRVVDQICSTKVRERENGLADLKHILSQNRRTSKLEALNDKGYHILLECLFRGVRSEKLKYEKSKRTRKNLSTTSLSACAGALRTSVEVGVRTIRYRSVKALIDHITQTLPSSDESYCNPLVFDYVKTLKTVLRHPPHPEHLPKEEWRSLVGFCNEVIKFYTSRIDDSSSRSLAIINRSDPPSGNLSRSATPGTLPSTRSQAPKSQTGSFKDAAGHEDTMTTKEEEFVHCLRYLCLATNAPLLDRAQATIAGLLGLLQSPSATQGVQQAAFATINAILARAMTEDIELSRQTIREAIPLIRRIWHVKSTTLREEMLITMLYGQFLLPGLSKSDDLEDYRSDLQGLLDVLQTEYCRRTEREQLQITDLHLISFSCDEETGVPLTNRAFSLRAGNLKSEQAWAVLEMIASISLTLYEQPFYLSGAEETGLPHKRQKVATSVDNLLESIALSTVPEKFMASQALSFIIQKMRIEVDVMQTILEALLPCISSDLSGLANWAMLAASCAAYQEMPLKQTQRDSWLQIWRLAARNITSESTCQAACHVMATLLDQCLVEFVDIADLVEAMLSSVDLNGPVFFTDSSVALWCILINLKARINPGLIHDTSERVLRWIFIRWNPSKLHDRHRAFQLSQHCQAPSIIRLISTILGFPLDLNRYQYVHELGAISQAKLRCLRHKPLMKYLLLAEDNTKQIPGRSFGSTKSMGISLSDSRFRVLCKMTTDFLSSEITALLHYSPFSALGGALINVDVVRSCCSACVVALGLSSNHRIRESSTMQHLQTIATQLRLQIAHHIRSHEDSRVLADGLFNSFGLFLGSLNHTSENISMLSSGARAMTLAFDQNFWQSLRTADVEGVKGVDFMELDDERSESQHSRSRNEVTPEDFPHDEITAMTNSAAYRSSISAKMCLISTMEGTDQSEGFDHSVLPVAFVEYLTSLPPHEYIACRPFLKELLDSGLYIDEGCGCMFLEYLGPLLAPYDYERCEVILGVCLDVMTNLANLWTTTESSDISSYGSDIYEWLINVALTLGFASPHTHQCMALMLQRVVKARPDFAKGLSLPSARTSLFQILGDGNLTVKFQVGLNVSDIFGLFILKEHDAILEDVIDRLPSERDWTEGIALRLFILAHLGSSWSTLLRRCIYAIFETPGHVQGSTEYAKFCLNSVSRKLGLRSPRELFRLFVSQIIYTWLETQPLDSIPFSIFGYASLAQLLRDVRDEVTGQIIMRGKEDEAQQLVKDLGQPYRDLLRMSFSKAAAYSIARDAAVPPARDKQASGADVRLRKGVGKEQYAELMKKKFPEIIAILFKIIDQEDHIRKGFQKRSTYATAGRAYDEIILAGASGAALPVNQQPSFKAGYLIDEIDFLCQRTVYDPGSIWTPSLYVYVFRQLLGDMHPALGSLHACSVIRRLRILISMARGTALCDYPLEMALRSLRPYLTDTSCAEDVIGIFRYLLSNSTSYLQKVPSFLIGFTVAALASMKAFLATPQESTTQESDFRATMSKAQQFHRWLGDLGNAYTSLALSGPAERSFKAMVSSARQLHGIGNARKGTYESELLMELLEDQRTSRNLIDRPSRDLILSLLCSTFEVSRDFREDILGIDEQASKYAPVVWSTCRNKACGQGYLLWAGRVIGRAYCSSGLVDGNMLREVDFERLHNVEIDRATSLSSSSASSSSKIISLLSDIVLTGNSRGVGIAEMSLQRIVTNSEGNQLYTECERVLPASLFCALTWQPFICPTGQATEDMTLTKLESVVTDRSLEFTTWVKQLCIALVSTAPEDPLLSELSSILNVVDDLPERMFVHILHLVLLREADQQQVVKRVVSDSLRFWFQDCNATSNSHSRLLLHAILYLRSQPMPHEATKADRSRWLDFDHKQAANAAVRCQMFKTALLLIEVSVSETAKAFRRLSDQKVGPPPNELLLHVFQNLNDKDSFYGIQKPSSIYSMMDQLEYENTGFKSLSFRGAYYDSKIRYLNSIDEASEEGMIQVLDKLDLNGLSQSLLVNLNTVKSTSSEAMLRTARKLERWDLAAPPQQKSQASILFKIFQDIHNAEDINAISATLDFGFATAIEGLTAGVSAGSSIHTALSSLAVLTEVEEMLSARNPGQLNETWLKFESRKEWMLAGSFEHVTTIASCRETMFSMLSKKSSLQSLMNISPRDARRIESRVLLASSALSRHHIALQSALTTATYLTQLVQPCKDIGVNISAAVEYEGANVLWDQGEMSASIRMLQDLLRGLEQRHQDVYVGKPELLARLGHRISEARLEKPDEIISNYLVPAIEELHGITKGNEAGQVFHEFAFFCDQQLQNADNLEDYKRAQRLRERKETEIRDLNTMINSTGPQAKERENLEKYRSKANQWFDLDDREFRRLRDSRQAFLRQSLENYLLSLTACDIYGSDASRFSALWLEYSEDETANGAVAKNIAQVASRKFASMMNQWTSRLLDAPDKFQSLLASLVLRICVQHPYHGMYQIFASSKTKGGKDEAALSRQSAATRIVSHCKSNKLAGPIWLAIHNPSINYIRFAGEKLTDTKIKPGSKVLLRKLIAGPKLEQDIVNHKIPPPTMSIRLREDCDYSDTPLIVKYHSEFTVASGASTPKILTALASDGKKYKQLFKSSNDDLRQDSIMEQVFEQVSNLLQTHRETRQRNLGIRTYKVLPLTSTAGIIEFVSDTIPLNDYLMPAHQRHFPGDLKTNLCRKNIGDVQAKPVNVRIDVFKQVMDRFHPVMRYFFMERFENPDDWFEKRLAYTRSTAAISILGHVLGLGDRHGHNILLDEKTGEVIHIDLGIAFEQGRILPIPEVVPFRLTRDVVDGMGITETQGVFQRSCIFTLEALRNESYTIMTILDVLRYDPLYSWSLSPLRLKKLQKEQNEIEPTVNADDDMTLNKKRDEEPGEADRALTVVAKKLSKSLSVTATVNELIQQATDVRNLAVLFCGWAAYA